MSLHAFHFRKIFIICSRKPQHGFGSGRMPRFQSLCDNRDTPGVAERMRRDMELHFCFLDINSSEVPIGGSIKFSNHKKNGANLLNKLTLLLLTVLFFKILPEKNNPNPPRKFSFLRDNI